MSTSCKTTLFIYKNNIAFCKSQVYMQNFPRTFETLPTFPCLKQNTELVLNNNAPFGENNISFTPSACALKMKEILNTARLNTCMT